MVQDATVFAGRAALGSWSGFDAKKSCESEPSLSSPSPSPTHESFGHTTTTTTTSEESRTTFWDDENAWKMQIKGVWTSKIWAKFDAALLKAGYQLFTQAGFCPQSDYDQNRVAFLEERKEMIEDFIPFDCVRRAHRIAAQDGTTKNKREVFVRAILDSPSDMNDPRRSQELETLKLLQREDLRNDPRSICIRVLDIIEYAEEPDCNVFLIVQESGGIHCWDYPFKEPAEWHKFVLDVFQGIDFLHSLRIAHLDIGPMNLLYDPETKKVSLIDFEGSQRHPDSQIQNTLSSPIRAVSSRLPEAASERIQPFSADVWLVGDTLLQMCKYCEDDLTTLFKFMALRESGARPTMAYALERLKIILSSQEDLIHMPH